MRAEPIRRSLRAMKRKGGEKTKAKMAGKMVRIWSGEWRAWWRHKSQGYTDAIDQAGIFTFDEAWATSHHCGPEKRIIYVEVRLPINFASPTIVLHANHSASETPVTRGFLSPVCPMAGRRDHVV